MTSYASVSTQDHPDHALLISTVDTSQEQIDDGITDGEHSDSIKPPTVERERNRCHACFQVIGLFSFLITTALLLAYLIRENIDPLLQFSHGIRDIDNDYIKPISTWDHANTSYWKTPLRTVNKRRSYQQSHTAVCIQFNWEPESSETSHMIHVQSSFHKYLTIITPVPPAELTFQLPPNVNYIHCVAVSVVKGEPPKRQATMGAGGALQQVCAAACFEYYANHPIRGVLWQADDMYINHDRIFSTPSLYPPNMTWSPPDYGHDIAIKSPESLIGFDEFWFRSPVGSPHAFIQNIRLLQRNYESAYRLAFHGNLDLIASKANVDFFYVTQSHLKHFVEMVHYLASADPEYYTIPDLRKDSQPNTTIQVRVGLSMSEWFMPTMLRLSAALGVLEHDPSAASKSTELPLTVLSTKAVHYLWGSDRNNVTLVEDLCLNNSNTIAVHVVRFGNREHRAIYLKGYHRD